MASKDEEIAELRAQLARYDAGSEPCGAGPKNIVWILGASRGGSTWLMRMMAELPDHRAWDEPMVGELFGRFFLSGALRGDSHTSNFAVGNLTREAWVACIRNFVLDAARRAVSDLFYDHYLVIKEPNGSIGAPLLMEALPESRMILLIRDPRDVVASSLDANRYGDWLTKDGGKEDILARRDANAFVQRRAARYLEYVGSARQAYESHEGRKALVRYEELRVDTLSTMKRLYSTLGIAADEEELERAVEKHSWENIPEEEKGEGKFYRKATPGSWREDLTPEQASIVEKETAPLLKEFYAE